MYPDLLLVPFCCTGADVFISSARPYKTRNTKNVRNRKSAQVVITTASSFFIDLLSCFKSSWKTLDRAAHEATATHSSLEAERGVLWRKMASKLFERNRPEEGICRQVKFVFCCVNYKKTVSIWKGYGLEKEPEKLSIEEKEALIEKYTEQGVWNSPLSYREVLQYQTTSTSNNTKYQNYY